MRTLPAYLLSLTFVAATPTAQSLYALVTSGQPQPTIHELPLGCGPSLNQCTIAPNVIGHTPHGLGGLALFQRDLYVTDGVNIQTVDTQCNPLGGCATFSYGPLTDIAIDESPGAVRMIATNGNSIAEMILGCPVGNPLSQCSVPGATLPLDALDWDRQSNNIWVTDSAGLAHEVQRTGPFSCTVLRTFPIMDPTGALPALPIGGIAVHPCGQQMFIADAIGRIFTMSYNGIPLGACTPASFQAGEYIVGLALRPRQPTALGAGCSGPGCGPCAPTLTAASETVIPNPSLRFDLNGTPGPSSGALASLMMSLTPGPLPHPLLCAPLQVGGQILTVNTMNVLGGGGSFPCDGHAFGFLAIPNVPGLCGVTLFLQWATICPAGAGIAVSNGLAITLD